MNIDFEVVTEMLAASTISSIESDQTFGKPGNLDILSFPPEILVLILKKVGSRSFNKPPQELHDCFKTSPKSRDDPNYAVKNLMSLRRVCTTFDDLINNQMIPGEEYDQVMIGIKIKGTNGSRAVTMFKYGGTGSQYPSTYLNRIRRFNEYEYQHIEKFEKIESLNIVNMILTEELFDTILKLDLTKTKKITFEKIVDLNFDESIDVIQYIQAFLTKINANSPAVIYFNSLNFDPNLVLFGVPAEPSNPDDVENNAEILRIETNHNHRSIRRGAPPRRQKVKYSNGTRAVNVVNRLIHNSNRQFKMYSNASQLQEGRKKICSDVYLKTINKSPACKKNADFHLKKIFSISEFTTIKKQKRLLYHLKCLKMNIDDEPMSPEDQELFIKEANEEKQRNMMVNMFPFLKKSILPATRLYCL